MNMKKCVDMGLIKKAENAKDRVAQSLSLGDRFLGGAKKNFGIMEYEICELASYNALFHYARALLFRKGYIERSHACLFSALAELYPQSREMFESADKIRAERHNLQYGGFTAQRETAGHVVGFVEKFGAFSRKVLGE